jgi:hypothetical protein
LLTHSGKTNWSAVWAANAAGVIAAACVGKLPPAIPLVREEFRLSQVDAGWDNSIFNMLLGGRSVPTTWVQYSPAEEKK